MRLGLADRLRCRLADLDTMPVAEFHLIVAGYADRNPRDDDEFE